MGCATLRRNHGRNFAHPLLTTSADLTERSAIPCTTVSRTLLTYRRLRNDRAWVVGALRRLLG
jgi:hypothetical protein